MGSVSAKTYFPNDNTHTNSAGAQGEVQNKRVDLC